MIFLYCRLQSAYRIIWARMLFSYLPTVLHVWLCFRHRSTESKKALTFPPSSQPQPELSHSPALNLTAKPSWQSPLFEIDSGLPGELSFSVPIVISIYEDTFWDVLRGFPKHKKLCMSFPIWFIPVRFLIQVFTEARHTVNYHRNGS